MTEAAVETVMLGLGDAEPCDLGICRADSPSLLTLWLIGDGHVLL